VKKYFGCGKACQLGFCFHELEKMESTNEKSMLVKTEGPVQWVPITVGETSTWYLGRESKGVGDLPKPGNCTDKFA
jgi:hypothetical protein